MPSDAALLVGVDSTRGRLLRRLALALSLLALAGSALSWYLDPVVPGKRQALESASPSGFTRGAVAGSQ